MAINMNKQIAAVASINPRYIVSLNKKKTLDAIPKIVSTNPIHAIVIHVLLLKAYLVFLKTVYNRDTK